MQRFSSFEDDEFDENEKSLQQILIKFKSFNENQDLGNTEQYLIDVFNADSNACLICIESIESKQAIWNCSGCFAIFHIPCIQNWIKDGSYLNVVSNFQNDTAKEIPWNCPKCRKEYKQKEYPSIYFCYCKKTRDPVFDPWGVPHSCNQKCNKTKHCGHLCLMLCHPGPCPPCPTMVNSSCYCKKSNPVPRRCSNKTWSCNKPCKRLLKCKQHMCEQTCHPNDCDECSKTSIQFCKCKKSRKQVLCTQTIWQCEQKCLRTFSCGFHKCELVCHEGECGLCPRSKIRTCPCGKSTSQKPCNEEIGTCGDTCNKKLDCNIHKCVNRCHYGHCEQCRQEVIKKCRCGQKEKTLPCYVEFSCETKCNKMRACGKHKCNKKCCDGNCPPCEQTCNKALSCKNHKCKSLCHSGNCYPCPIMEEISCPCGSTKIKIPCVKSKVKSKVPCKKSCNLPAKCHHPNIQPHRCHYDLCPSCKLKCDMKLKCGHFCQQTCHSHVLTEITENKEREGPWVKINVKKEFLKLPCGDCIYPIPTECLGGHEISDLPCNDAKPFNCGRKCDRPLKCGHHTCQLDCHAIPTNESDKTKHTSLCQQCERACEQPRPNGCEHECSMAACHPSKCPDCKKLFKLKCHCNTNFVYVECAKWISDNAEQKEAAKSCQVPCPRYLTCGHNCTLLCHSGNCSSELECKIKVNLKCACKTLKRTVICNKLKLESDVAMNEKEKKFFIKCGNKCELKKKPESGNSNAISSDKEECNSAESNQNRSSYFLIWTSFFVLIIAILVYLFLFR